MPRPPSSRYVLAEADPHAPFRQEFDDSSDLAGKPIPGFLCRVLTPQTVLLSMHDRASQVCVCVCVCPANVHAGHPSPPDGRISPSLSLSPSPPRQVTVHEDRLTLTGFKFYCTVRANHSVSRGTWYFETKIADMKEGAATRIGWAQRYANLQVPLKHNCSVCYFLLFSLECSSGLCC